MDVGRLRRRRPAAQLQQRVFDRAHTVLTPDQMNAFETAQKAQLQMQKMGVKMGKAMFGGDKAK